MTRTYVQISKQLTAENIYKIIECLVKYASAHSYLYHTYLCVRAWNSCRESIRFKVNPLGHDAFVSFSKPSKTQSWRPCLVPRWEIPPAYWFQWRNYCQCYRLQISICFTLSWQSWAISLFHLLPFSKMELFNFHSSPGDGVKSLIFLYVIS